MQKRREAGGGVVSLIGALTCATITAELLADAFEGTHYFPLRGSARWAAVAVFALFTGLEARKVQRRLERLLQIVPSRG